MKQTVVMTLIAIAAGISLNSQHLTAQPAPERTSVVGRVVTTPAMAAQRPLRAAGSVGRRDCPGGVCPMRARAGQGAGARPVGSRAVGGRLVGASRPAAVQRTAPATTSGVSRTEERRGRGSGRHRRRHHRRHHHRMNKAERPVKTA